ncbi:receptor-like serine/threonine-protein kinase SD1-8 [Nymphaea colorata]|nr:receptor-like serine/threonine-protein kinase SD1-8 [Nymphaea colorata]
MPPTSSSAMETRREGDVLTRAKMSWRPRDIILPCFLLFHLLQTRHCFATDTIIAGQSLTGGQTITSAGGIFELGFFSLGNPSKYYIGIWFKEVPTDHVVWVANRDKPLQGNTSQFMITEDGNLVIRNQLDATVIWSTNLNPTSSAFSRAAVLLDNGNLVLRDGNSSGTVMWDSFSHPTNTLLPGGILRLHQLLFSWKNTEDPFPGQFSLEFGPTGTNQSIILRSRLQNYWITGVWNGQLFSGRPEMGANLSDNFSFVIDEAGKYLTYTAYNNRTLSKLMMDVSGQIKLLVWVKEAKQWNVAWAQPGEQCAVYDVCGAFGICNQDDRTPCECVNGFKPTSAKDWELNDWSGGCMREAKLQCGGDQFSLLSRMRSPENPDTVTAVGSEGGCKSACTKDCSCTAYSYQGSRCSLWRGDLFNLQQRSNGSGDDIYIRVASLETSNGGTDAVKTPSLFNGSLTDDGARKRSRVRLLSTIIAVPITCGVAVVAIFWRCKSKTTVVRSKTLSHGPVEVEEFKRAAGGTELPLFALRAKLKESMRANRGPELPIFALKAIMKATNSFAETNKLGQGGFGAVYRGKLAGGKEVAMKRLSKGSKQGIEEFMNEVGVIAKLQHRNLVQLLGCCIEAEEKILVYEYMPNKSLDTLLFDSTLSKQLDWEKRFEILLGIARGLHYLHQESRLTVIHRDLKTSNVLLDGLMNPRISDFGLARIYDGRDKAQVKTQRVVGTYGYMSPEYALEGRYSTKSDVFSFGVIVLEVVSGQKVSHFHNADHSLNLLGHAWKLWNEGAGLDLLDHLLCKSCSLSQVMRCINVGLLCVQEDAADRPSMSSVVLMLGSESAKLPKPKQPAYSYRGKSSEVGSSSIESESAAKEDTISVLEAR